MIAKLTMSSRISRQDAKAQRNTVRKEKKCESRQASSIASDRAPSKIGLLAGIPPFPVFLCAFAPLRRFCKGDARGPRLTFLVADLGIHATGYRNQLWLRLPLYCSSPTA